MSAYVMKDTFIDLFETMVKDGSKPYTTFQTSIRALLKQYMVINKQNARCSHFLGPLGRPHMS